MPIAQQFLVRALAAGPANIVQGASMGALSHALDGGAMGASMEAARSAAGQSIDEIQHDLAKFSCGAARAAMENTPIFGPVFRLGESAIGHRMCEPDDMTVAERQSLARGAAADLVAPGASFVMSAIEIGASKQARPILESISPGITQSAGYKSYASALRADDPDRATQLANAKAAADETKASIVSNATPSLHTEPQSPSAPDASDTLGLAEPPAFASAGSISGKLAARRAAAVAANEPEQPSPGSSTPAFSNRM